jgi:hypothetical protein
VFGRIVEFLGLAPWTPGNLVNVSRQGRAALPDMPAPSRVVLAVRFERPNRDLIAMLGDAAPRW